MHFAFSEEQDMLRSQAKQFLADKFPLERVGQPGDHDASLWQEMAGLGWMGLSVSEEHGGAGMAFLEEAVLLEEMGYALYPGPYLSTVAMALPAAEAAPALLTDIVSGRVAATVAWSEDGGGAEPGVTARRDGAGWRLTGQKHLVPDLDKCDVAIVDARAEDGDGLWVVDIGNGRGVEVLQTMDVTRRLGRLTLDEEEAAVVAAPGQAPDNTMTRIRLRTLAALALEATGVSQRALDLSVDQAKSRQQFGKPIGAFQAVSHQVADAYMATELARSLAYWAAWCVTESENRTEVACAAAKSFAADAAVASCERAIQVHGGIGFTTEHVLHRYYKRAQWIAAFAGSSSHHRKVVAEQLLSKT